MAAKAGTSSKLPEGKKQLIFAKLWEVNSPAREKFKHEFEYEDDRGKGFTATFGRRHSATSIPPWNEPAPIPDLK